MIWWGEWWGWGSEAELFTCPYPLKGPGTPIQGTKDWLPSLGYRAGGGELIVESIEGRYG